MKVMRKRVRSRRFIILAVVMSGLLGCAGSHGNLRTVTIPDDSKTARTAAKMTSDELERSGDMMLKRGDLHMAFVQYEKILRVNPENTRVLCKKGLTLIAGGLNQDAVKIFQEVVNKDPEHATAYEGLGRALFQMTEYAAAEQHLRKAVTLDATLWQAHNCLGIIYNYRQMYDAAIDEYAAAIRLKPGNGQLYNNLGISYSMAGAYESAVNAFDKALEARYLSEKVYNNLGLALAKLGRHAEALGAFRNAGDEARAYNNLGCAYLRQGELQKAVDCFEKAIEMRPTFYAEASENLRRARTTAQRQ